MKKMFLYDRETPVFRVNLHTHTTTSDGLFTPAQTATLYSKAGYDCLALTDHKKTNNVAETYEKMQKTVNPGMELISGVELHPDGPRGIIWHILALGVPQDFQTEYKSGYDAAQAVRDVGGLVYAAHPYWCGLTTEDVRTLGPLNGTEVYNSSCRHVGKEYCMYVWDEFLNEGAKDFYALAVDDFHTLSTFTLGWTMIAAEAPTQDKLLEALRKGQFYSTQGPEFYRVELRDGHFIAEFSEAVSAVMVSNGHRGGCATIEKWPIPEAPRGPVTRLDLPINNLPKGCYVRCQIRDAAGHMAWSMPLYV